MNTFSETKDTITLTTNSVSVGQGSFVQLRLRSKLGLPIRVTYGSEEFYISSEHVTPMFDGVVVVHKDPTETEVFIERSTYNIISKIDSDENFVVTRTNSPAISPKGLPGASGVAPYSRREFLPGVGIGGSEWYSNGSRWKPVGGEVTLGDLQTPYSGIPQIASQFMAEVKIKAGTVQDGDIIRVTNSIHKSGTVDSVSRFYKIGTVQGSSGGTVLLGGNTAPGTTNRSFGEIVFFRRVSPTQIRPIGNGSSVSPFSGSSATAALLTVTVPNMDDNDLYLASVIGMTSGTETPIQDTFLVELLACGG